VTSPWLRPRTLFRLLWRILRAVLFGWLYWLQRGPGNHRYWQVVGVFIALIAGGSLLAVLWNLPSRLGPIENPAIALSIGGTCEKWVTGGTFLIEVEGGRYECTGSDHWCPTQDGTMVAYDRSNPSRCRAATNLQKLSRWELANLLSIFGGLASGFAFILVRENDSNRLRAVVGHGLLLLAVFISLWMWKFDLSTWG
jgi:hypothetical protein